MMQKLKARRCRAGPCGEEGRPASSGVPSFLLASIAQSGGSEIGKFRSEAQTNRYEVHGNGLSCNAHPAFLS
jgi:hypothetical protein